jgi:hypothetical protein
MDELIKTQEPVMDKICGATAKMTPGMTCKPGDIVGLPFL